MTAHAAAQPRYPALRPLLKWAGGKTQMLELLRARMPRLYGRYLEPFVGGGALFFAVAPQQGLIADSNPELVNLYRTVAQDVGGILKCLREYDSSKETFYALRALDWQQLTPAAAAARTLFLNRLCFNGLYRVNRAGHFNVPYGRYKNPRLVDETALRAASVLLQDTTIVCGDYRQVLQEHARAGDFVFLDPPYLPLSAYADFKRYTREPFQEQDHLALADEVRRLYALGCHVLLTNSNHPLVHAQYQGFAIEVVPTRRAISCNGAARSGEDVLVQATPAARDRQRTPTPLDPQVRRYPPTRYMGSKNKLLASIWSIAAQFPQETVLDLFSGSGVVGYMLKAHGRSVTCNDHMALAAIWARALIENKDVTLPLADARQLLEAQEPTDRFVETQFQGLYFSDDDNRLIDVLRHNIKAIQNPYQHAIAMSALTRACLKKRARGIFTYVGQRYDDGRKDLQRSLRAQFLDAVALLNAAVFDNGKDNRALQGEALDLNLPAGLVYLDPPYYSPLSDSAYVRRYHFVEGLARDWQGVTIQEHTRTRKFRSYPTPFSSKDGAAAAFDTLFQRFREAVLLVSYSSNSQPTQQELTTLLKRHKSCVECVPVAHRYSFGNQGHRIDCNNNRVQEYLFVAY